MAKEQFVVYNRLSAAAYYSGAPKKTNKAFKTQAEAKKYASKLARQKGVPVYDSVEGREYTPRKVAKKASRTRRQPSWW